MAKVRHKQKRPTTRLWDCRWAFATVGGEHVPVVYVKKGPVKSDGSGTTNMVRACTAKAAGRRFRNSIPWDLATSDHETTNMFSPSYMDMKPEYLEEYEKYAKQAKIIVEK